jgi:glutamate N-acetyltransferase/amino-acid N-acetyltransferase
MRLDIERIEAALPELVEQRGNSPERASSAARAILTTDTRTKEVLVEAEGFVVGGMAKGAAMLSPNMATMLAVLTTDASASHTDLQAALGQAVRGSFNEMTVDGCTSTNDTVIVMASGLGSEASPAALTEALAAACRDLAAQMVADAEGGTKVVRVRVVGAVDDDSAGRAARRVAESQLVKSSWYGEDANWGRVVSELGSAGTPFDPDRVSVAYGAVTVCRGGVAVDHDEKALGKVLASTRFEITCDLGLGSGSASIVSADLTPAYVELNMGRS